MKKYISNILSGAATMVAVAGLWSCAAENPFDSEGSGVVQLRTVVNNITTRADEGYTQEDLENKCVIYISDKEKPKGQSLVYKAEGLKNVAPQITLKSGNYAAEAWTGDSVTASFDKKFYRGYTDFNVTKGSTENVVINCRIANVVASINTSTINPSLMEDDYEITVKNSRGEITFNKDNAIDGKAYFMMPNGDNNLEYIIKGTRKDGEPFEHAGVIENVQRAHHYILNFEYNPTGSDNPSGYVFIKINIKDEEIADPDDVIVFTHPTISGTINNEAFDLKKQLNFVNDDDIPDMVSVQICGDGIKDIRLTPSDDCTWKEILDLSPSNDIVTGQRPVNMNTLGENDPVITLFNQKGIEFIRPAYNESTKIETAYLNFSKDLFMRLTRSEKEHKLEIYVSDRRGQESTALLRTARTEGAVEVADPIEVKPIPENDWQNVKTNSANISFKLSDAYEGVPGLEYSKANEDNWTFVAAQLPASMARKVTTRAENDCVITINGLEEGTTYKYRACCGDFRSENVFTFTTEAKFIIPNASMEEWSDLSSNSKVRLPSGDGNVSFWDSGNHGSATMSKTLTQGSDKMFHSGSRSAELVSQFVGIGPIGKFAAGNLFAGSYDKTDGTDGELTFGREYNGSHPAALSLWANYRPGKADSKGANNSYIKQGELDEGQIYVALSTKPISIKTKSKQLFDPKAAEILAYGEVTWTGNFGPDGTLEQLTIPLEYYDRAKTSEAKYIIIVCSASKYGDFFSGGEKSTMYVDDFELIYE